MVESGSRGTGRGKVARSNWNRPSQVLLFQAKPGSDTIQGGASSDRNGFPGILDFVSREI